MDEKGERLAVPDHAPQGEPGEQGERGKTGPRLSSPVRRSLVFMFALAVILAASGLFWIAHEVHASQAAIQASQAPRAGHAAAAAPGDPPRAAPRSANSRR